MVSQFALNSLLSLGGISLCSLTISLLHGVQSLALMKLCLLAFLSDALSLSQSVGQDRQEHHN